jgi:TolB-like protein
MKTRKLLILVILAFFSTVSFGNAWGGQVVTDEAKAWAKQALEQEKGLKAAISPNAVAVLYFINLTRQSDLDPLQKGIAVMLITDLSKVKSLAVVERIRLQALVEEMKLGVSGLVEENSSPRMGKLLGAHWLVGGSIQGGSLQLKSSILDVSAAQITGQPGVEGNLEELLRMEKDLVSEIIKLLKIVPTPQEETALRKPMTNNIKALLDFFKGIVMSDLGNYEEAAKYYQNALKADPGFDVAKDALEELRSLGLIGRTNKSLNLLRSLRNQTSLTNQVTPQEPVKRLVTPQTTSTIETGSPGLPEPPVGPSPQPVPQPSPQPRR